jgi:hypothetical protein
MTNETGLELLRKPFPEHHISKLPKPTKAQTDQVRADFKKGIRCVVCGGWHHPDVIHLDYVGHAALTDRLLDADPNWFWEPLALGDNGYPVIDRHGGMWIKLTICGVTRLGYGHAGDKQGGDAIKEVIGDALRNAAMRFGAALDLWHKGDLHLDEESEPMESAKSVAKDVHDSLPPEQKAFVQETANHIIAALSIDEIDRAHEIFYRKNLDNEEKMAVWALLDSKIRAALKSYDKSLDQGNAQTVPNN